MRDACRVLLCAMVLCVGGVAHADRPVQVTEELDFTFPSGFWTRMCGFVVFQTVQGTLHVSLHTAPDGLVREIDTFPSLSFQLSAPSTGGAFSYPLGPVIFEYPDGVYVGAPSVVTTLGLHRRVPGLPAEAGRTVFEGVVVFVDEAGVPVVDFGPPAIVEHGNVNDLTAMIVGACAALSG
jgi:hypothetical protein